jgi:hypothetical protein
VSPRGAGAPDRADLESTRDTCECEGGDACPVLSVSTFDHVARIQDLGATQGNRGFFRMTRPGKRCACLVAFWSRQ